jgi:hypothetical protein
MIYLHQKIVIKLFCVSPLEMCDERTASKMTAWSTTKRNGLSAINIINMGILEKYWKYGFNNSRVYMHSARLTLDSFDATAQPPTRTLPVPTLHDLLNPVPLDPSVSDEAEAMLFKNPDPYGNAALEEDEDYEFPESAVIRSLDAPRLAIEEYIELQKPALVARLSPDGSRKGPATKAGPKKLPLLLRSLCRVRRMLHGRMKMTAGKFYHQLHYLQTLHCVFLL